MIDSYICGYEVTPTKAIDKALKELAEVVTEDDLTKIVLQIYRHNLRVKEGITILKALIARKMEGE